MRAHPASLPPSSTCPGAGSLSLRIGSGTKRIF